MTSILHPKHWNNINIMYNQRNRKIKERKKERQTEIKLSVIFLSKYMTYKQKNPVFLKIKTIQTKRACHSTRR